MDKINNSGSSKPRRVNRKRKALSTAKQLTQVPLMWNICHNTQDDIWQVLILDQMTKRKIAKGPVVQGRNNAYAAFTAELEKELDTRTNKV